MPAAPGPGAGLYVCGITPYDATHLGHAATAVTFDLLRRAWLDQGLAVRHVSNVTDVDDPLLERAAALGVDWRALAAEQSALYAEDMTALAVLPPDVYLGAVESIGLVIEAVSRMLHEGLAYRVPLEPGAGGDRPDLGDVYADAARAGRRRARGTWRTTRRSRCSPSAAATRTGPASAIRSTPPCGGASGRGSRHGTAAIWAPGVRAGTSSAP